MGHQLIEKVIDFEMNYLRIMKILRVLFVGIFLLLVVGLSAQCPMCRMAAESNLENGGTAGAGLNTGILYMLSMPYLIVMVLGYIWYRNRKNFGDVVEEQITASLSNQPE